MKITLRKLKNMGFIPADLRADNDDDYSVRRDFDCVNLSGFENIMILRNDDVEIYVGQIMDYWHLIDDAVAADECVYMKPLTIGLETMTDFKKAVYYVTGYKF